VKLKDWPGLSRPESHTPAVDVVVWSCRPVFCHVTVVPAGTMSMAGLKAKSTMLTAAGCACAAPGKAPAVAASTSTDAKSNRTMSLLIQTIPLERRIAVHLV
jgi:hypothetical protein